MRMRSGYLADRRRADQDGFASPPSRKARQPSMHGAAAAAAVRCWLAAAEGLGLQQAQNMVKHTVKTRQTWSKHMVKTCGQNIWPKHMVKTCGLNIWSQLVV
jgi:hypothetical protein